MARHIYLHGQKLMLILGALLLAILWLCPVLYAQDTPREKLEKSLHLVSKSFEMANYAQESDITLIQKSHDLTKQAITLINEVITEAENTGSTELKTAAVTALNSIAPVFTQLINTAQAIFNKNAEMAVEAENSGNTAQMQEKYEAAKGAVVFISKIADDALSIGDSLSAMAYQSVNIANAGLAGSVKMAANNFKELFQNINAIAKYIAQTGNHSDIIGITNHIQEDAGEAEKKYDTIVAVASSVGGSAGNGNNVPPQEIGVNRPWPFHWNYLPLTDKQRKDKDVPIQDTEPASPFGAK